MSSLLEIRNLSKTFPTRKGDFFALKNLLFSIKKGEILGLVGESGSGKSTLGKILARMLSPTSGEVYFEGYPLHKMTKQQIKNYCREVQMIFQNPYASLNPLMTVGRIIEEPLKLANIDNAQRRKILVHDLLNDVGLDPLIDNRFPHEFSGGERQRICIARAISLSPTFVICDEPTAALDASIQAQIINLLKNLQNQRCLTYLFISHNLALVRHICHRIIVLYRGEIVEIAATEDLFSSPKHPYTQELLSAIPKAFSKSNG